MRADKLSRGYTVMLPGIESSAWQFAGTVAGMREAGVDGAIDVVEWGGRCSNSLRNLTDLERNRERAAAVALRIAGYHATYPDGPITLIGYSGGGGVAVLATEALPDEVMLDRLILIAAAIAPDYDLDEAMVHCREGVINFYSEKDWFVLGIGTRTLGTIDRQKTDAAGRIGFRDTDGSLRAQPGLTQIEWRPSWGAMGHGGGHVGWLAHDWARDVLATQVRPDWPLDSLPGFPEPPAEPPTGLDGTARLAGMSSDDSH